MVLIVRPVVVEVVVTIQALFHIILDDRVDLVVEHQDKMPSEMLVLVSQVKEMVEEVLVEVQVLIEVVEVVVPVVLVPMVLLETVA